MAHGFRQSVRPEIRGYAKHMRAHPAPGEAELWEYLRAKRLGFHFRRQVILRGFVADFWCPAKRLVVEVDGASHQREGKRSRDCLRDQILWQRLGIRTLRFPLESVLSRPDEVVARIRQELASSPTGYIGFCKDGGATFPLEP